MSNITSDIEKYIYDLLEEAEDENIISLRRKELAEIFGCVPSQINYVLRSRFSPEHGFLIESRRGGQGYIKILRIVCQTPDEKKNHVDDLVGRSITQQQTHKLLQLLQVRKLITARERLLIEVALKHNDENMRDNFKIDQEESEAMQAQLLKKLLRNIITKEI